MKSPLLIYGAGGLGRELLSLVRLLDNWDPVGFIDDNASKQSGSVHGVKVFGRDRLSSAEGTAVVLAFGDPKIKKTIASALDGKFTFPTLIHPAAILQSPEAIALGRGTVIAAGCVLTCDITIGDHVLVNLNTTIGHDSRVGDFSSVMPGVNIAGEVEVGDGVLIGSGSNIINRVRIGDNARVGMGSVVIRDVEAGATVVGVPAKPLSR